MTLATVVFAERDAEAIFRALTCGTPTSNCPAGVVCTWRVFYTCTTNGTGFFSNCVNGNTGCFFSTYSCPGTDPSGVVCSCSGSDLDPSAC
jgi:hypothetical protein